MNWSHSYYNLPGKQIALACSDAAGANACCAIYEMYRLENRQLPVLFSNRANLPEACRNFASTQLPDFTTGQIDCLFTGTSHPDSSESFEVNCIREARLNNVYVVAFIDHWTNFALRFKGLDSTEMPNEIWVVDEKAKDLAIEEGLPAETLKVRTNPYHYYLRHYWRSSFTEKNYLRQFGIPDAGLHLLFAPDPLTLRNRKDLVGFSEADALKDVLDVVEGSGLDVFLIVKSHPLQPVEVLEEALATTSVKHQLVNKADACELIHACDLILGFYSNFLLDAMALNKKVLRYYPGNEGEDLLKHTSAIRCCKTLEELRTAVLSNLN